MKYFLNKKSDVYNLYVLLSGKLLISSCEEKDYETVEEQFLQKVSVDDILAKREDTFSIGLEDFTALSSMSTDDDIDISYLQSSKENITTIVFETPEQKQLFLTELKKQLPEKLTEHEHQKSVIASIAPSLISLAILALTFILYFQKLPKTTYIVCGIWLLLTLYWLFKRFKAPPVITRWTKSKSKISKGIELFKTIRGWGVILAVIVGVSMQLPKDSGVAVIHDHAVKEALNQDNLASLIDKGGDVNFKDSYGQTALFYLIDQADSRSYEITENLLVGAFKKRTTGEHQLDKEKLSNTPEKTALALIKAGADVNVKDNDGVSIMQYAILNYAEGSLSTVLFEFMLQKGAKLDFVIDEEMSLQEYLRSNTDKKMDGKHLADVFAKYQ